MTATSTATPPRPPRPTRPTHRIMTGDRMCTRCGYNLVGQEIIREAHYSLLIVRCPECATVASVQEYPLLGAWAARWGAVLAALWLIVQIGLWPASSGIMLAFSLGITDQATQSYAGHLSDLQVADQPPTTQTGSTPVPPVLTMQGGRIRFMSTSGDFDTWWEQQDRQALLAAAGGWRGATDAAAFLMLIPASLAVFLIGCFWSISLIQLRRRWLIICGAAIVLLALLLAIIPVMEWQTLSAFWPSMAARQQLGLPVFVISAAVLVVPLVLGLRLGRPLVRSAICALLPPRLRSSLSLLWTAEGLEPPTVRTW